MQTLLKKIRRLTAAHVLTFLFLGYIFYAGIYALPELLYNVGRSLHWQTGLTDLIGSVDAQYEGMLSTEKHIPLLQNKGTYINLNGQMAKFLGQDMMNERVKLKNGHLTSLVPDAAKPQQIRETAENLIRFRDAQTERGGHFLFVMAPSQISKYEDLLPTGYTDTTNDTADALLALLAEAGVDTLDLRESLHNAGISHGEAFYVTDHHWLPQTGFRAYGWIVEKLTEMGAADPVDGSLTDGTNFAFDTWEDAFLGSWGKRTGLYYAGADDTVILRPTFETRLKLTIPERELELAGSYEEICYNTEAGFDFENPDYFQESSYSLYGWGDNGLARWRNEQAPVEEKLLLIGESFGNIPFSLLSIPYSSCDELDMRHYTGDFSGYYAEYAPDTVVILVNVDQSLSENTGFDYIPDQAE